MPKTRWVAVSLAVAAREQTERVAKRGGEDRLYLDSTKGHLLAKVDGVWVTLNLQGPSSSALPAN
jgi:hypothetical protein